MATAPPGWYPDPQGPPGSQRYWSGSTWTEHVQAPGFMPPPPPPPTASGESLAGYGQRVGGWLLDWLIVSVVSIPVAILVGGYHTNRIINSNGGGTYDSSSFGVHWWGLLVGAVLVVGYGTVFCGSNRGQTIGMMAVGVRVVDAASGLPIGYRRAVRVCGYSNTSLRWCSSCPGCSTCSFRSGTGRTKPCTTRPWAASSIHKSFGYP